MIEEEEETNDTGMILPEGHIWCHSPDCFDPEDESVGIIALMFYEGSLYFMKGEEREWRNVEIKKSPSKPKSTLRSV